MTLKTFLNLVEIRTKLASMIPFFLGSVYVVANTGNETEYYHLQCFEGWKGKRT